jgi:hypothetical protein
MPPRKRDTSLAQGVYFASDDYVGIMRRVVILVVDLAVLITVLILFDTLYIAIARDFSDTFIITYLICVWAYLTVLKASRIRTVGYWLTGSRILNLRGRRPSIIRMTFRLLLWAFGPFNVLFDLLLGTTHDPTVLQRQRIRLNLGERLAQGSFERDDANILWVAHEGDFGIGRRESRRGIASLILFQCPGQRRYARGRVAPCGFSALARSCSRENMPLSTAAPRCFSV